MQTQRHNSDTIGASSTTPSKPPRGRRRWLAGLWVLVVVGLLIASSVVVFSLVGKSHVNQGNGHEGQWKAVQQGYLFLSIKAAASNPAVLYACATTSAAVSNQDAPGMVTVLRSGNGGDSWQNIGANLLQNSACGLAVNPANSDDVYVFSGGNTSQAPGVLHHTTDGGDTWQVIQPRIITSPNHSTQRLFLQQLTFAGNSLLAINWIFTPIPMGILSPPTPSFPLPRLVRSIDGGQIWTIIDSQFTTLAAQGFAVAPSNPNTIYELLGHPLLPIERAPSGGVVPTYSINQQLYKTTDGGVSWTLLLDKAFFGSQVQIAANNPSIVYVGGVQGPIPLVAQGSLGATGAPAVSTTLPRIIGGFHLQVSRDGGTSWQVVATPPGQAAILNWFVSADGHVFTSPTVSFVVGVSATVVVGTAVAGTAIPFPPCCKSVGTPQGGSSSPPVFGTAVGGTPNTSSSSASGPTDVSPPPGKSPILNYDPASNSWSKVVNPPASGEVLAVTAGSNGEVVIWFLGVNVPTAKLQYTLYRFVL